MFSAQEKFLEEMKNNWEGGKKLVYGMGKLLGRKWWEKSNFEKVILVGIANSIIKTWWRAEQT